MHEIRDARAAIDHVRDEAPDGPTVLCGWSFGANVALREALDDPRVAALVLLGIPLDPSDVTLPPMPAPAELRALKRPVLLIAGDGDPYAPAEDLRAFTAEFGTAEIGDPRGDRPLPVAPRDARPPRSRARSSPARCG